MAITNPQALKDLLVELSKTGDWTKQRHDLLGDHRYGAIIEWFDDEWWGPLDALLGNSEVHDIFINGPQRTVYIGRNGQQESTALKLHPEWIEWLQAKLLWHRIGGGQTQTFLTDPDQEKAPRPINPLISWNRMQVQSGVSEIGHGRRRVRFLLTDQAATPDGSSITLRVLPNVWPKLDDLVASGMLPNELAKILRTALASDVTIIICGGTGSGKTTVTAALKTELGLRRSVVIQDAPEIPTGRHFNDVSYIVPDGDTSAFLGSVRAALRQQPERIIVGEGRGPELSAMIEAAATGHPGLTTIHATNAGEALLRLETYASKAPNITPAIVRANLTRLPLIVVHVSRLPAGRRVTELVELRTGQSRPEPGQPYETRQIMTWRNNQLQRTDTPLSGDWANEVYQ